MRLSQIRDRTHVSCTGRRLHHHWAAWEALAWFFINTMWWGHKKHHYTWPNIISFLKIFLDVDRFWSLYWIYHNTFCFTFWLFGCIGRQSLNHWTTREVPNIILFFQEDYIYVFYLCLFWLTTVCCLFSLSPAIPITAHVFWCYDSLWLAIKSSFSKEHEVVRIYLNCSSCGFGKNISNFHCFDT